MPRLTGEILIRRPVEDVFDFVADERNEPRFNPRMLRVEKLTEGPIATGTRFRADMKTRSRPSQMTIEYTAYERPNRLASTTQLSSMTIAGSLAFSSAPQGTRLCWDWDLKPRGLLRLLAPIIAVVGRRQEHATWSNLKRLLEGDPAQGDVGARAGDGLA